MPKQYGKEVARQVVFFFFLFTVMLLELNVDLPSSGAEACRRWSVGGSGRQCELCLALTEMRDTHYDRGTCESMEAAGVALTDVDGKAAHHFAYHSWFCASK